MSVANEISRIKTNIKNAYATAAEQGAILPTEQNSDNLASTMKTITGGGGSGKDMLQARIDATNSAYYLFHYYEGDNVDYIANLDTSNVTNMSYMFDYCSKLTTIPALDTGSATNMSYMFDSCGSLITIPALDTSSATDMSYMFSNCYELTTIPALDTSNATNMSYMFNHCRKLPTMPALDTSSVTDMHNMCSYCYALTTVPALDTSSVTDMSYMFQNCRVLTTILALDMCNVTNANRIVYGCTNLTNLTLRNIKVKLQIGSGSTYGHLLTVDSLVNTIKELIDTGSSLTLTMGGVNTEKLANVYVKLLDDDGSGKLPCEVCASTDEGAMPIINYALLKNWSIA